MADLKLKPKYITKTPHTRLHGLSLPLIGLTGGIASGKSSVSNHLKKLGFCIIDADVLIHKIYAKDQTKTYIKKVCPSAIKESEIDFKILRKEFFDDKNLQNSIEQFLYKELPNAFADELATYENPKFIIYDVPLLFEKDINLKVDLSVTVYAPRETQIKRLIKRDNISLDLGNTILDKQMSIELKKEKSDYCIDNSRNLLNLDKEIQVFIKELFE